MDQRLFSFAISATFTAEPVQPVLNFWGRRLNTNFEASFAPYNQLLQTLLDPNGEFALNQHGINVVLARIEDLGGSEPAQIEANLRQLVDVLRSAPARMSVPLLVALCPPSPGRPQSDVASAHVLDASLAEVPGLQFLSCDQIARLYPVEQPHSPEGERLGRIPYTDLYFCALGTAIVRHAHALLSTPYKVIALDCDNTLWDGICGEDGPHGVVVDSPRRALQQFMAEQREDGMLLVLASKNNEADVIETFENNPSMPLQLRHFAGWRLNWDSKAVSLASIAQELSLGLDSFIFVDDNPKECAEVEQGIPEVLALALPANAAEIPHFLDHVWAFDHPVVTEEDRQRNAYYSQSQEFGRELRHSEDLAQFMHTLGLHLEFQPLEPARLARVAQLTQRTNQFNFTTIRRKDADLQALMRQGYECLTVDVSDRFGDYGLVGVVIFRATPEALEIDTLLLSCRALGRGVEHRIMAHMGAEAVRRGSGLVIARINATKRNQPARRFLEDIGTASSDGSVYTFEPAKLSLLEWTASEVPALPAASEPSKPATTRRFVEFATIARTLSNPQQILEAMRAESHASHAQDPSLSATESRLATLWTNLLQQPVTAATDNFFDLGGHSLLAVMLIMRVRESFGVELPIDDVYSSTLTLGELARKIEMYQLGGVDSSEYESLLREIEELSDEEVERLLAEETASSEDRH